MGGCKWSRRQFLKLAGGTAGIAAAGGAGLITGTLPTLLRAADAPGNGSRVAVASGSNAAENVRRAIDAVGGIRAFVSRGDDSGTHRLEKRMWKSADLGSPEGADWYVSVGAGMMHALRVAGEMQGYCLTDTATWLKARKDLDLEVIVDSDQPEWENIYSILLLSPERFPGLNREGARSFSDFVVAGAGRRILRDFGVAEYGEPVFRVP